MPRNLLYLTNIGDQASSPVNAPVTLIPHTFIASDVANGVAIVDFFTNVDASGVLLFSNPSSTTGAVVTLKQGPNIEGTSFDVNVPTDAGIGDQVIVLHPSSLVALSIVDSSLYGQITTDTNGNQALGIFLDVSSTDESLGVTVVAIGKYPQIYTQAQA